MALCAAQGRRSWTMGLGSGFNSCAAGRDDA
eukprot:CAMPEP_0119113358 /NCGR_PEP_ID=MMETSP1180-20130426/43662_1 /TAXON_ID=3052 ORGANISM="Chlamydomonas cf sp, Strain CCMP681" /NCGR_SAMPLE_ID=MMETSP1180 /ASSEMBLY_ACC=CAM_ASM_000741 /LENGTH=30 /DNA_ID= /DNA_START= /DNA_END= /DNA_ORIENTATION=